MSPPRRIVIVDDNRDLADLLSEVAASFGLEVHTCYDGLQARSVISALRPQLAMLDISMPGIGGDELARWVRRQEGGEQIRLIALTGHSAADVRDVTRGGEFDLVLTKPLDLEGLQSALGVGGVGFV